MYLAQIYFQSYLTPIAERHYFETMISTPHPLELHTKGYDLQQYYQNIIRLKSKYNDPIIDEYYLTLKSMLLTKSLAEQTQKDLSRVEYSPVVKKLYKYKGSM